jgi:hypothetical protein
MKKAALLFLALLCCSLLLSGCGSSTPAATTSVVSIQIVSPAGNTWDSKQGMEFYLVPRDLQGKVVGVSGTLEVKLFHSEFLKPTLKVDQAQQWNDVKVSPGDFDAVKGALIRLEYRNYTPSVVQPGTLDVTLQTQDGKKFTATAMSVVLKR